MAQNLSILILAAGQGTRMKSALPKMLHTVCEVPMLVRVVNTALKLKPRAIGIIVGHGAEQVKQAVLSGKSGLKPADSRIISFITQKKQNGSGDAVRAASAWIRSRRSGRLLILCGDTPLVRAQTLSQLARIHSAERNAVTLCSMEPADPSGYGRIVRDDNGVISGIVEENDASVEQKAIREVNSGIYCFDAKPLLQGLPKLKNQNAKREFYLTDLIEIFYNLGQKVGVSRIEPENGLADFPETMGINSRADLAQAESLLQDQIRQRWMKSGVTLIAPASIYIGEQVVIGPDTVLLPGTILLGKTRIGPDCRVGPNTYMENSVLGRNVIARASFIYGTQVGDSVQIGPFTHLRPGTVVQSGARIGNFTEIKKSRIGKNSKVSHLAYIGDAVLGENINVGAGAITCNFDGEKKHPTYVGSNSFIGSNVNLVAPVRIGAGSLIGAGSTITRDVPPDSLALERAPQTVKRGWMKKKRKPELSIWLRAGRRKRRGFSRNKKVQAG